MPKHKFELSEWVWYDLSPSNHEEFEALLRDRDRFFDLCREYEDALREIDEWGCFCHHPERGHGRKCPQQIARRTLEQVDKDA